MKLDKVLIVRVRYYETLHVIRDDSGEQIFVGSEETAKRVMKLLKRQTRKPRSKRKAKGK